MTVDASRVEFHALIRAMWRAAPLAAFFAKAPSMAPQAPTDAEIDAELVRNGGYIDYLNGRPIKTSFRDLERINCAGFDRDAGGYDSNNTGALARIVASLLSEKQ
jgi:hypothetical protein